MAINPEHKPVAVVTGGAVRVGKAIASVLGEAGFRLALHYHRSTPAAHEMRKTYSGTTLFQADLTEPLGIERLAKAILKQHERIDVLVNSAADFFPTPLGQTTVEQWDRLHHLNLRAPYFLTQALLPALGKGSCVVNVVDVGADTPFPDYIPYGATKAGLIAVTRGLARALAPDVRVNGVAPGPVMLPDAYDEEARKRSIEKTLLKHEGSPDDVAKAVRYLVQADYVTGAILPVDGGRSLA